MKVTLTEPQEIDISVITHINGDIVSKVEYTTQFNAIRYTNKKGIKCQLYLQDIKSVVVNKITIETRAIVGVLYAKYLNGNDDDVFSFMENKVNFCELSGTPTVLIAFCNKVHKGILRS